MNLDFNLYTSPRNIFVLLKHIKVVLNSLSKNISELFQLGCSLYGYLLEANKPVNMVNVSKDVRFNAESDTLTGQ